MSKGSGKEKLEYFCRHFHECMEKKGFHSTFEGEIDKLLALGKGSNRQTVFNYEYGTTEFILTVKQLKGKISFTLQRDKTSFDIDREVETDLLMKFDNPGQSSRIINHEQFNNKVESILHEILDKLSKIDPAIGFVREQERRLDQSNDKSKEQDRVCDDRLGILLEACYFYIFPHYWVVMYILFMVIVIPLIFQIIFNLITFITVRSSTRRIHDTTTITGMSESNTSRQQYTRDMRLLKHILFMFVVFIFGWAPYYIIIALPDDIFARIPSWIIISLQIPPVISSVIQAVDLFIYSREIRQYLKKQLYHCWQLVCT
ncbi:hypothetical protein I4U23_017474 [Adineta vaga]|nr:hypothetical protein I4U23_017474 [Adineta vaga]